MCRKCWFIEHFTRKAVTYDHRLKRKGHPVRSAILKLQIGRLVVGWVTTSEYPLLYVFCLFNFTFLHAYLVGICGFLSKRLDLSPSERPLNLSYRSEEQLLVILTHPSLTFVWLVLLDPSCPLSSGPKNSMPGTLHHLQPLSIFSLTSSTNRDRSLPVTRMATYMHTFSSAGNKWQRGSTSIIQ